MIDSLVLGMPNFPRIIQV